MWHDQNQNITQESYNNKLYTLPNSTFHDVYQNQSFLYIQQVANFEYFMSVMVSCHITSVHILNTDIKSRQTARADEDSAKIRVITPRCVYGSVYCIVWELYSSVPETVAGA